MSVHAVTGVGALLVAATAAMVAVQMQVYGQPAATEVRSIPGELACSDATVDGSPIGYAQEQAFLAQHVTVSLYRAPGTYWVVFPSTGDTDKQYTKPEPTWVPDDSVDARTTCAVYLTRPTASP